MSINWQDELNHEWLDERELLEDFEAHQVPLSAGDEGYMATTGAISKETPNPGEPPSTPELRCWTCETVDIGYRINGIPSCEICGNPLTFKPHNIPNSLEVLQALEALLEACPTSCEDRALIDAQRQAEQAIRRARG